MTGLQSFLQSHVDAGTLPGAVALVARGDHLDVAAAGTLDVEGTAPMEPDSIVRIASITKPITAAAALMLVEDGRMALDDPVATWLPELAAPMVVRTPASPVDDVVPAVRPITVFDVLTAQAGYGFPSDFSLPAVGALFEVQKDGREPRNFPPADEWMAALGRVPLLYQPGEAWLYDTCSVVQGVLVERVAGQSLPDLLAERVFAPLGMVDTAFEVPAGKRSRFASYYVPEADGLRLVDGPDGQWSALPALALGNGGLAGTAGDWLAFGRMLLAGGVARDGRRLLSEESVRLLLTDHTTAAQRKIGSLFLEGQGWGMGGSVDIATIDPWNVPGRYGWIGGSGTTAHVVPASNSVVIALAQVGLTSPAPPDWMRDFWRFTAEL